MSNSAVDTSTEILSALDFEPVLACEHPTHDFHHAEGDPAAWVVTGKCACGYSKRYLLCESGRVDQTSHKVHCPACGASGTVDDFWRSVAPLDAR